MRKYIQLILLLLVTSSLYSCEEKTPPPTFALPSIETKGDTVHVNLNLSETNNIPVEATVKAEAGLDKVNIKVVANSETLNHTSITEFENNKNFLLSKKVTFQEGYKEIIIEATDVSGQTTSKKLSIKTIEKFEAPTINFEVDSIVYNILSKEKIPQTGFSVHSDAGLEKVEMFFKTKEGDIAFQEPIKFPDNAETYHFSELIEYELNTTAFEVKATDIYGNTTIVTLPIIIRKDYPQIFLDYKSAGNREFNVYTNVADSLYAMFRIVHQKNEQQNRDLWRVMDSYLAVYEDGKMTRSFQILTPGENEFVWLSNRPEVVEFTGGFHGNERIDRENCFAHFYLDSTEIDLTLSLNMERGTSFFYHQVSLMYETGTGGTITSPNYIPVENAPVECTHEKITTFEDGGFTTKNKVVWTENAPPIKRMYYGIFCVTGDISSHGYNDTGSTDPVIIPFVNDGAMKLRSPSQRVVMYNSENNISVECDGQLLQGGPFTLNTYVWDHQFYHKYYTSINNGAPIQTTKDEVWETESSIKLRIHNTK